MILESMDYSVDWQYIVNKMTVKGYPPNSTEKHEFAFFKRKLDEIWSEFFEKTYSIEVARNHVPKDTITS